MNKYRKNEFRIVIGILCAVSLLGGCGNSKQQENVGEQFNINGKLHCGYFYQDESICLATSEHFIESSWNLVEFDYICQEITCTHNSEDCSAKFISYNNLLQSEEYETNNRTFSFEYLGKRIILITYCDDFITETVDNSLCKFTQTYKTEIYEAELDGSNRKLVVCFDGGIDSSTISYASVLKNGKLYFGGMLNVSTEAEVDEDTGIITSQIDYVEHAFYQVDLLDYSVNTIGRERTLLEEGYTYQAYQGNNWIYLSRFNNTNEKGTWYAINNSTGEYQEIARFEMQAPTIVGIMNDVVYADRDNILYQYDWMMNDTIEEFYISDNEFVIADIFEDEIWIATDMSHEEGNEYVEYTVMDKDRNVLRTNHYSEYITFLDVIGDKVLYLKPFTEGIEEWWCELDKVDTLEDSVYIGDYFGRNMK